MLRLARAFFPDAEFGDGISGCVCFVEEAFPTKIAIRLAMPPIKMMATPVKTTNLTRESLTHGALLLRQINCINPKNAEQQNMPRVKPTTRRRCHADVPWSGRGTFDERSRGDSYGFSSMD